MRKFNTANLTEAVMRTMNADEVSWVYNGLDCCVTYEIRDVLREEIRDSPQNVRDTYFHALQKHGPILEMSLRGIRIDQVRLQETLRYFVKEIARVEGHFNEILREVFELTEFNWRSPMQLQHLFYTLMKIKPVRSRNSKGQFTPTVNRKALEKFCTMFYAQPIALHIMTLRDLGKKIGFLKTEMDPDGRFRTGYNIAGTNTGRLSSSANEFATGTNAQNIAKKLRAPFIADPRMLLVNVDLEQADARNVGARIWEIFYDTQGAEKAGAYLDACESGDLHTTVCRMAWTELEWGADPNFFRMVADQIAYRDKSYRDLAKALGHGTNFYGQPRTMAVHANTAVKIIEAFQTSYFTAFPLIPGWHKWVADQLQNYGTLTTLYGRRRHFFNRMKEPATLREAIAYEPQSMTAYEIDQGYMQLWRSSLKTELLIQVHDSILFQCLWRDHEEIIPQAVETLKVNHMLKGGRNFHVPLEAETGFNWAPKADDNPLGLTKYRGIESRNPPSSRRRLKDFIA